MKKGNKSADWFIKKSKKGNPRSLEKEISTTLINKAQTLASKYYPKGVKIAIDITKQPVYSKSKSKFITNGSAEKGTTQFYQFLGFSISERQLKFPIAFHLMEKGDLKILHQIINEILSQVKNKFHISMLLLDRWFSASKIVRTLYNNNQTFIIAFKSCEKLRKVFPMLEHPKTMKKNEFFIPHLEMVIERIGSNCWVIKGYKYGNPSVKVNLVFWKTKKRKSKARRKSNLKCDYFLYITSPNVSPLDVYQYYGKRWRIETAFRQIKDSQAKTRVINPTHRIWLFAVACLIYASWSYRHLPKDPVTIIPEDLLTEELEMAYQRWIYRRIPLRELVDQYLAILNSNSKIFTSKEG